MTMKNFKNSIYPVSSNPVTAVKEIKKFLKNTELNEFELDLSAMNLFDAVKVLVFASSYLYTKSPAQKLKFKFVSSEIRNILTSFSLTNLEMV